MGGIWTPDQVDCGRMLRYGSTESANQRDPYFDSVVSLMHMTGFSGSATLGDEKGIAWTNSGMTVSATQSKFGGGSMHSTFSPSYLLDGNDVGNAIGTGDFTFEHFAYRTNSTQEALFTFSSGPQFGLYVNSSGTLEVWISGALGFATTETVPASAFAHVAITRSGTTINAFINGVKCAASTTSSKDLTGLACRIANQNNTLTPFTGYMNEWRASKRARYATNFTPPTKAFYAR